MRKIIAGFVALAALALAIPSSPASAGLCDTFVNANPGSVCVEKTSQYGFPFNARVVSKYGSSMAACWNAQTAPTNDVIRIKDFNGNRVWGDGYRNLAIAGYEVAGPMAYCAVWQSTTLIFSHSGPGSTLYWFGWK